MKDWWNNLALREKQTVLIGALSLGVILFYLLIWSPLNSEISFLRDRIQSNQRLLSWMQTADQQIATLEKNHISSQQKGSLLSIIQNDLNNNSIGKTVTQIQQSEDHTIEIEWQTVSFDDMIAWLTKICEREKLSVSQLTVTMGTSPGIVGVNVKLIS